MKFLLTLLKYCFPIALLTVPCAALMGILTPWPIAAKAMGPEWARESVLIGVSHEYRSSGNQSYERRTQTYLGLPNSRHAFQTIRVTEENGVVRTEEDPYFLLAVLVTYAAVSVGTWWFWIRPRQGRPSEPQNL